MPVFRTLLALLACASFVLADHEVRTLSGKTIKGKVVGITASEVVQQGEAGPVKTPLAQVLAIDLRPAGKGAAETAHTLVRLVDDSSLLCRQVQIKGNEVELTLLSGQAAKLPLSAVAWLLKEAQDGKVRAKWDQIVSANVKRDRIVVLREGELAVLEGTLGDADAQGKTIQFRPESGEPIQAHLDRLHGLIFYRTELPSESAVCRVYDTEGDVLAASKVSVAGDAFQLTTPAGLKLDLQEKVLARLDYNRGKLTYLSDLEPVKVVERSRAGLLVRYQRDKNLDGQQPIVLVNQGKAAEFNKGLSLHAYTELEYDLGGKYKDFKAVLGVDARTGSDSHAIVTIECDGEKKFSATVSADVTVPIALNVRDVRRLRIIVSSQNFLDLHDHATLAEARVSQ
jgi:hypothetical protein